MNLKELSLILVLSIYSCSVCAQELSENVSDRMNILDFCEQLRAAIKSKDTDFLETVLNGTIILEQDGDDIKKSNKDQFFRRYRVFWIHDKAFDCEFSEFEIEEHPKEAGMYGVTFRQKLWNDIYNYGDHTFLFMDIRNKDVPIVHVLVSTPLGTKERKRISVTDFKI